MQSATEPHIQNPENSQQLNPIISPWSWLRKKKPVQQKCIIISTAQFPKSFDHRTIVLEIRQRQVTLKPTFKHSNPEIIHIRCDLKMKSFPSPSSGLLYQLFSLLSTLFPQIFTRMTFSPFRAQFNQHILGENFPDYPS